MTAAADDERAAVAAHAWGAPLGRPRRVAEGTVRVFEVRYERGLRVALRLHPETAAGRQAAIAEQRWTESLADTGFACPWPQRTVDGALVPDLPEGTVASAVQWIDAPRLPALLRRDPAGFAESYRTIGTLLADLHLTSDAVAPEDLGLPDRSLVSLCQALAEPGGAERAGFDADAAIIAAACSRALPRLTLPDSWSGLIHGDIRPERILVNHGQYYLTGFARGGRGLRLQDLALALLPMAGAPDEPACQAALLDGYFTADGPLPRYAAETLAPVLLLCALSRIAASAPSASAPGTIALARRVLSD